MLECHIMLFQVAPACDDHMKQGLLLSYFSVQSAPENAKSSKVWAADGASLVMKSTENLWGKHFKSVVVVY